MSVARLFGVEPESLPVVRRLALLLSLTTGAEIVAEGVVLSAFIARIGATSLPTALALRAVAEVLLSLAFERAASRQSPGRAMRAMLVGGTVVLAGAAALSSSAWGVYAAYVVVSSVARIKAIHFGVLALAALAGPTATRALPLVHAGGRVGGIVAGPVLALVGPVLGSPWLVAGAAALFALSLWFLRRPSGEPPSVAPAPAAPEPAQGGSGLLAAILVGAVALALGRLALTTQSGAILERAYGEAELNRVLGGYFAVANLVAFVLQALVVGRVLAAGGLPLLNSGWSWLYLAAQAGLSFGPPSVAVALAARLVEGELRNALRTPVANLLYEAMPAARRAFARTVVIGVAVPVASLVGGLGLGLARAHPAALSALGLAAAALLVLSSWAQNRGYARAQR